jgi:hypothetical protein
MGLWCHVHMNIKQCNKTAVCIYWCRGWGDAPISKKKMCIWILCEEKISLIVVIYSSDLNLMLFSYEIWSYESNGSKENFHSIYILHKSFENPSNQMSPPKGR